MAGVDSLSVAVLEPECKGCCSTSVAGEGLPVGPLGREGPVRPFVLAVLPGAVGLEELLPGPEIDDCGLERSSATIGEGVVRDDAFYLSDAVARGVFGCAGEEPGRGCAFLVRVDLGIGEAGVVIDCAVGDVEPDAAATDVFLVAVDPPAAAVRDPGFGIRDPGSGIRPSFLTSMWTRSPGRACS